MTKFTLVNPRIEGSVQTEFDASSPLQAADEAYSSISKYFTNRLQEFRFTLQSGGKYHHYIASEMKNKDASKVSYTIAEFKGKVNTSQFEKSQEHYQQQMGGRRRFDDDDSDDSDSSPPFRRYNYPIYNWWYDPFIYLIADKDAVDKIRTIWQPSIAMVPGNIIMPYYPFGLPWVVK
jgi:hypothetical protein